MTSSPFPPDSAHPGNNPVVDGGDPFQAVPYAPVMDDSPVGKNSVAPWALAIGLLALLTVVVVLPPVVLGPIGIILSFVALSQAKKRVGDDRRMGMSIAGLILSVLATIAGIIFLLGTLAFMKDTGANECVGSGDMAAVQECVKERVSSYNG